MNNKKVLWILNQFAISPDMPGGTRHYDFAFDLIKRGYKVYILASDFSLHERINKKLKKGQFFKIENINGVNFVWIRCIPYYKNDYKRVFNWISFAVNLLKVNKYIEKPNTVIGSSPQLFTALSGFIIAKLRKAKFIAELRDIWPMSMIEVNNRLKRHPYTYLLYTIEFIINKFSESIIVFTEGNKQYLINKGIDKKRIHIIPNGVNSNIKIDKKNAKHLKDKYNINKFSICYTGSIGMANNLDFIVDLANTMDNKNIEFIILGDGPRKSGLLKRIEQLKLKNIRILPPLPKSEIYDFLYSIDICFITLKNVNLFKYGVSPNKLFDYMYAEKPIISAVGGECNDIVKKAKCGISVMPDSIESFKQAIDTLYNYDKNELKQLGKNGREFVTKYYSRKVLIDRLIKLL